MLSDSQIKGARVDLRIDNVFYLIRRVQIESYDAMELSKHKIRPIDYLEKHIVPYNDAFILHPGDFALAPTFESFKIPQTTLGELDGRSSLGRLGIIVHVTAGSVDPGFSGPVILELANLGRLPVKLFPMMRIASLKFLRIEGNVKRLYKGKYAGIDNLLPPSSRLHEDDDLRIIAKIRETL
jgi:dCTP deaminase